MQLAWALRPDPPNCTTDLVKLVLLEYVSESTSQAMLTASSDHANDAGSYHACMNVEPAGAAEYCLVQARAGWTVLETQAACLPASCPVGSVLAAMNLTYLVDEPYLSVTCGDNRAGAFSAGAWCTLIAIMLLLLLVVAGSLLRLAEQRREAAALANPLRESLNVRTSGSQQGGSARASRSGSVRASRSTVPPPVPEALAAPPPPPRRGPLAEVVVSFAVQPNLDFLFLPSASRKFTALEGMRTLSMLWIILGHTIDFQTYVGFDQTFSKVEKATLGQASFLAVLSASYAVDCFFLLSGFLGGYVLLGRPQHIGLKAFLLRYLRLTPTLAVALAFYAALSMHTGSGPYWYKMAEEAAGCSKWWWSNLLYVNNFAPANFDESCMSWTWYLACDTQMFLVGLPVLALRASKREPLRLAATALCVALVLAAVVATWILLPVEGVTGTTIATASKGPSLQNVYYDKPYCRMAPYFLGTLLAFNLRQRAAVGAATLDRCTSTALLVGAVAAISGVVWFQDNEEHWWTKQGHYAYVALSRPIFGAAVGVILWLCVTDHAPWTNWLLSLPIFDVPAKLTYSAYLVHPIIIRTYWFKAVALTTYSPLDHMTIFFAMACYAYICAVCLALLVELPSANLIKLLMPKKKPAPPVVEPVPEDSEEMPPGTSTRSRAAHP